MITRDLIKCTIPWAVDDDRRMWVREARREGKANNLARKFPESPGEVMCMPPWPLPKLLCFHIKYIHFIAWCRDNQYIASSRYEPPCCYRCFIHPVHVPVLPAQKKLQMAWFNICPWPDHCFLTVGVKGCKISSSIELHCAGLIFWALYFNVSRESKSSNGFHRKWDNFS